MVKNIPKYILSEDPPPPGLHHHLPTPWDILLSLDNIVLYIKHHNVLSYLGNPHLLHFHCCEITSITILKS